MRQNRFYLAGSLEGEEIILSDPSVINQLKNVLRAKTGDEFLLFNGEGLELIVEIKDFKKAEVWLKVLKRELKPKKGPEVCLYLAILKKENFELAVQKAVESGVSKIIPLITDRTIKLGLKEERLNLIIKEAAEQSGRTFLPELKDSLKFTEAVDDVNKSEALNLFCDLDQNPASELPSNPEKINIFVGPEGGWSTSEQAQAKSSGLIFYSLGDYVLRAETGAIVATWLAVNKKL